MKAIVLRGARTHNLAGVDLELWPGTVTVLTGPSGAGKSSLALDTLYSEGQRRFIESFSPYARQFLERLERPPMERLDPVAAGVAVDRRAAPKSSRSTVSTLADLEPYLAALFHREARPICDKDGSVAEWLDAKTATDRVLQRCAPTQILVTYPERVRSVEGYLDVRERLQRQGYQRIWHNGKLSTLDETTPSEVLTSGNALRVIVDRLKAEKPVKSRLMASIEQAWTLGAGTCEVIAGTDTIAIERGLTCPTCGNHFAVPPLGTFSVGSPLGACGMCRGFGRTLGIDLGRVIPDHTLSLKAGAIRRQLDDLGARRTRQTLSAPCDRYESALFEIDESRATARARGRWALGRRFVSGRDGLVPLARNPHLQDARACVAVALSFL